MAAATLLTKVISLVREWLMANFFGTSLQEDAWLMASVIPNRLFAAIDSGLSNVLVPTLAGSDDHSADVTQFLAESFTVITLFALVLVAIGYGFTWPLMHLIAPGFHGLKLTLTVSMTRIMLPTILFWSWNGFLVGILRSREAFYQSSMASIITSVLRIVSLPVLVLGFVLGVRGVAYGFTLAVLCQTLYLFFAVRQTGVTLGWRASVAHPLTRRMLSLSPPVLLSSSVATIGVFVDRVLASGLVTGSIAALNYSQVLSQLPSAVLLQSFAQPIFSRLSSYWNNSQRDQYDALLARGFILVAALALPVTLTFLLLTGPILRAIYEHGHYSSHSLALTMGPMLAWTAGVPAVGYGTYLSRALFAQQRTRAITWISLSTVGLNIAGDLILVHPFAATGLAAATSIAWWLRAAMLGFFVKRGLGTLSRPLVDLRQLLWLGLASAGLAIVQVGLPHVIGLTAKIHGLSLIFDVVVILAVSWGLYIVSLARLPILDLRDRERLHRGLRRAARLGRR